MNVLKECALRSKQKRINEAVTIKTAVPDKKRNLFNMDKNESINSYDFADALVEDYITEDVDSNLRQSVEKIMNLDWETIQNLPVENKERVVQDLKVLLDLAYDADITKK